MAEVASSLGGPQVYKQRAKQILPLLVRQAEAREPITYGHLATEIGVSNPRTLNFPLGAIGDALNELSRSWKRKVPQIQGLVVAKNTSLPGVGIGPFIGHRDDFARLPVSRRREIAQALLAEIWSFPKWQEVLTALGLPPPPPAAPSELVEGASRSVGGEGEAHRALKAYVSGHPELVGVLKSVAGVLEKSLPSGDAMDVSFEASDEWVGVEVKSAISSEADILRGLFQCVKYRAVMQAVQAVTGRPRAARPVLVLGGALPANLFAVRNALGVQVVDMVAP